MAHPTNNSSQLPEKLQIKKSLNNKIWMIGASTLLLLLVIGVRFYFLTPKAPVVSLSTQPVTRDDLKKIVAATGKVVANFEVEIKAKGSGKILRLPYDVSDPVKKGALLAELDPIDENRQVLQAAASLSGLDSKTEQTRINLQVARKTLETDLAKAKADLRAADAKRLDAQIKANRLATLVKNRYISQEEYETGTITAEQANADAQNANIRLRELQTQQLALQAQQDEVSIASAQAQAQRVALASSQQRLSETKIYAPISGVVTTRLGQIGQIVSSGISNVGGGTAIMTLADLSHIYVLASVDESDIGQVQQGQKVHITADAFPGKKFEGVVVRIAPKGFEETNVVTFEVKIQVEGPESQLLKPEMTTNVEILIAEKNQVLQVPVEAVSQSREGKNIVRVLNTKGKPERRAVITGLSNGTNIEIQSGLKAGDAVIIGSGEMKSRWRKGGEQGNAGSSRQGQRMMMRSMGK